MASGLAERLIAKSGLKYDLNTEQGKARYGRDRDALATVIRVDPQYWAGFAELMKKADKQPDALKPGESDRLKAMYKAVKVDLAEEGNAAKLDDVSGLKDKADDVNKSIKENNVVAARGGWAGWWDNERAGTYTREPALTTRGTEGLKETIVRESEEIRDFQPGDPYIYQDGSFKIVGPKKQELRLMLRTQSDDLASPYAMIVDVSKSPKKVEVFPLAPGTPAVVNLRGQPYKITMESELVTDPSGPDGQPRQHQDLVVHVFAIATDKKGNPKLDGEGNPILATTPAKDEHGKDIQKAVPLDTDKITLGGEDGLAARALKKAVEGHCNGLRGADGTCGESERYVEFLKGKKYYVSLQGGNRAGFVYYPADEAEAALKALRKHEPVGQNLLRPRFVTDVWICDGGVARAIKGGSTPVELIDGGESNYQYRWNASLAAWELKSMTHAEVEAYRKAAAGETGTTAPGTPTTPPAPPRGGGATDPSWPSTVKGPAQGQNYPVSQVGGINEDLRKKGASYRLYFGEKTEGPILAGGLYVVKAAERNNVVPADAMKGSRLPSLPSASFKVALREPALTIDVETAVFLFDSDKPKTLKDTPMAVGGGRDEPNLAKLDIVLRDPKQQMALHVGTRKLVATAFKILGFEANDVKYIDDKTTEVSLHAAFRDIEANRNGDQLIVQVKVKGRDGIRIWPRGAAAGGAQSPPIQEGPAEGAPSAGGAGGDSPSVLADTPLRASKGRWPPAEKDTLPDGKTALTLGSLDKAHKAALYTDGQANVYAIWRVFELKPGKSFAKAKFPDDMRETGENSSFFQIDPRMTLNALVLQDGGDMAGGAVTLQSDQAPGHKGALELLLTRTDANAKHALFISHLAFTGAEPNVADHKEHAYADAAPAAPQQPMGKEPPLTPVERHR